MPKFSPKDFIKRNFKFVLAGAVLLVIFYSFSYLVKEDVFKRFDFDMTVRIQAKIPLRIDPYFSILSLVGSFEVTLVILIVLIAIRRKIQGALLVGWFGFMHVVEIIGKAFLDHPGTPFMFHRYALDFFFPSGYVQPGGSYPSGHAMRTAYLSVLIIFMVSRSKFSKNLKLAIYGGVAVFYLLMVISRVSLGEHWTTDVIGGSILGVAFALFSLVLL